MIGMQRSYVGIVTARGLEALFPESERAVRLLDRRIYGPRPFLGFCCWAVLRDEVAQQVRDYLKEGDRHSAYRVLELSATAFGPIMPSDHADRKRPKSIH